MALSLETTTYGCWPTLWDAKTVVHSPDGEVLVFASRTVQSAPGRLSMKSSRYEVTFSDDSVLELQVGNPIITAPGLTEEYPGSAFRCKGQELVFTIEKPLRPVWRCKEGRAFRERLPERAAVAMETLAEARKVLRDEAVFAGFLEFFPALFRGEELGYGTRDGYSLLKVSVRAETGDRAVRRDVFAREKPGSQKPETAGDRKEDHLPEPSPSTLRNGVSTGTGVSPPPGAAPAGPDK